MTILIDLQYLPCLEYFSCVNNSDKVVIESAEHYVKQSYRNRCYIRGANKINRLSVPVIGGNSKIKIKDITIDYGQRWVNDHWRAIISAYGKSPFFEHYAELFHGMLFQKHKYLYDLNIGLLTLCLDLLDIKPALEFTTRYTSEAEPGFIDLRSVIHPKRPHEKNGFYTPCRYTQVFGRNFADNLSIIDLLFCEGPDARAILQESLGHKLTMRRN